MLPRVLNKASNEWSVKLPDQGGQLPRKNLAQFENEMAAVWSALSVVINVETVPPSQSHISTHISTHTHTHGQSHISAHTHTWTVTHLHTQMDNHTSPHTDGQSHIST